jgi:hypothetical protein
MWKSRAVVKSKGESFISASRIIATSASEAGILLYGPSVMGIVAA